MAEIKLKKRYKYAGDIVKALLNRLQWTLEDATEFINSIEDADVEELKHGEWLNVLFTQQYRCSLCGNEIYFGKDKFCSECGAKMDGGSDT